MRAEIIAIGDELTTGQRLDTNSQWLAERLLEIGVSVAFHTTVGDTLADNILVFRQAAERADVVVATGGLGPTADDLTRHALAALAGVPLIEDAASLAHIQALFARRKRPMPPANLIQAQFPQGSRPIFNPHGSAPGIDLEIPRAGGQAARVFALPGVPAEMKEMWEGTVRAAIQARLGATKTIAHYRMKCFGVGESDLEGMLPDLIARDRYPLVGITVSQATITLRITAEGETPAAARAAMEPTIETIRACLGDLIFGEEEDELQHAVARLLKSKGDSLAVVELGTGGRIANWFSDLGCPEQFRGGLVLSKLQEAKGTLPGLCSLEHALPDPGAAVGMLATEVRELFGATYGLAVGELPDEFSPTSAAGTLRYAVAHPREPPQVRSSHIAGHPEIIKARAAKQALNLLRLQLLGKA